MLCCAFKHSLSRNYVNGTRLISIPVEKLLFTSARSSGPGGQSVNSNNSKAQLKFNVIAADWISNDIKDRFIQIHSHRILKNGDLIINSQEQRSFTENQKIAINRLKEMLDEAENFKEHTPLDPHEKLMVSTTESQRDRYRKKEIANKQRTKSRKENRNTRDLY